MARPRIVLASLLVCMLWSAITTAGQTVGDTTGAINGKVTDHTGAVLQGVTIVLSSDAIIGNEGTRTAVTSRDGLYWFPALSPGEYTLLLTLEGFRAVSRQGIYVGVGFTATVNVEMEIAEFNQSVAVEHKSPVMDTQSTAITTRFDARELANLPGSRSTFAILSATPAVTVGHFEVGGSSGDSEIPYSAYGTRSANRPMVEGISVTGIFPSGFTLDYGSFDEVSVGTAVHGAEWPLPGVQMQFISKSGGNRYRGTLYADYEHHDWQSFNIDESQLTRGARAGNGLPSREANRLRSYHDINGDVGGYIKPDRLWWYSSIREQDVSARQVNFPVKPRETRLMNYTAKGTYQITPGNKLVMYGQAGQNHQPNLVNGFTVAPTAAVSLAEESTADLLASGWIWKGEWDSVVNQRLLFEVRVGEFGTNRPEKPNGTSPRFEDADTSVVQGGNRDWQENRRSNQVLGSMSYFKDGWLGSHHLKIGGETLRITLTDIWEQGYPGDVLHVLRNDNPAEVYLFQPPSRSENGFRTYGFYATDSWRLNGRLTLTPGLRFDRYRVFFPEQTHPPGRFNPTLQRFPAVDNVIDWNHLAPRIGAIYDLAGDSRTLLKFNYGQYRFGPGTNVGPNANPNPVDWCQRYAWSDLNHSGIWERGEEGAPLIDTRCGGALDSLDPDLQLPILKEVAASVERELFANVGIRTGVVWRGERQHYVRQNANRPFEAFTVPVTIPDPGPDNAVGTEDDGPAIQGNDVTSETTRLPQVNIVRNVPDADSHYWTWDVTATRRFSRRWSLVAGFAHTWNYDQANAYFGQSVRQNTYPLTPNDLINAGKDGRYEFRTWSAKIYGTYEGPWNLRVTPFLRHQSGQPFGRTFSTRLNYGIVRVLAEPLDTRRMDNITLLDMRVEKGFRLAERRRAAAFVDVFNLLNANPEETVSWTSGPSFLRPLNIVAPRIVRIGAKLEW
jgi:Carboxypeptidase regulatory-like domain/TonB dependent receptor